MTANESSEAREGLVSSAKGKAKEVTGAVTGNDSLTAEGQLQQEAVAARREASARDAAARAELEEARRDLAGQHRAAASERQATAAAARAVKVQAHHEAE